MMEKEKMYISRFGSEYLTLRQACQIWRKPGYSKLSKELPKVGYNHAVSIGIIPKYRKVGSSYLFKISDILEFLNDLEEE